MPAATRITGSSSPTTAFGEDAGGRITRDDLEHYETPVDARSPAVRAMIAHAVSAFKARDLEIGWVEVDDDQVDFVHVSLVDVKKLVCRMGAPRRGACGVSARPG